MKVFIKISHKFMSIEDGKSTRKEVNNNIEEGGKAWGFLTDYGLLGEYDEPEDADLLARAIGNAQRQIKENRPDSLGGLISKLLQTLQLFVFCLAFERELERT